ncbi:MAG: hypothetical protein SF187_26140 [Deltaproteobacteria bacterium]|nr:hypothetical protein [Deltaproteobacteria bacterium]
MLAYSRLSRSCGVLLVWAAVAVACDNADVPGSATTRLACEAFKQTMATPVTFEAFSAGPGPILTTQTTPFAVTLAPTVAPGQYSGHAQWQINAPGIYGMYVDQAATFLLRDSAKALVTFKHQLGSPRSCEAIGRYAFMNLAAGVYSIELGPTVFPSVRLQLVPTAANDDI